MTTIADITREKIILDNSEWFEGEDADGSFKSRIRSIRGTGLTEVTTSGASTTEITAFPQVVEVTTGGSGGDEILHLQDPTMDENGINVPMLGQRVFVYLRTQTDPADAVVLSHDSQGLHWFEAPLTLQQTFSPNTAYDRLALDFAGAAVCLIWVGYRWAVDVMSTNGNYDPTFSSSASGFQVQNGIITISGLPTEDPHAPQRLWNNAGVLTISAG